MTNCGEDYKVLEDIRNGRSDVGEETFCLLGRNEFPLAHTNPLDFSIINKIEFYLVYFKGCL
jgi:hypothetical protein